MNEWEKEGLWIAGISLLVSSLCLGLGLYLIIGVPRSAGVSSGCALLAVSWCFAYAHRWVVSVMEARR